VQSLAARVQQLGLHIPIPPPAQGSMSTAPIPIATEVPPGHTEKNRKKFKSLREQCNYKRASCARGLPPVKSGCVSIVCVGEDFL
jgi:hypothetical protein